MGYLAEERETIIQTDDASESWNVYTRQQKIMTKLRNLGYESFNEEMEGDRVIACEFSIPINKLSFRNPNSKGREYTDEQKQELADRLAKAREKKNGVEEKCY